MTTFTKTITTVAVALIFMSAATAQARQSDFVPTSEIAGPSGTKASYMQVENLNRNHTRHADCLNGNATMFTK